MNKPKIYDYVIIGAGISGCSVAYELAQHTDNILLVDKLHNIASGASGAAGAFLSPLLGKPNYFKELVTKALKYTTKLYKTQFPNIISNCGTTRIPKNDIDKEKFQTYKEYMDFAYKEDGDGYFFQIGSVINSFGVCKMMTTSFSNNRKPIKTKFDYKVIKIEYIDNIWIINDDIKTKNIICTTGAAQNLLNEPYIKIRSVWGRRIDIKTTTKLKHNYHKECSVSKSFPISDKYYKISIGATHHRDFEDAQDIDKNHCELLQKASTIVNLEDVSIEKKYIGARACSVDYIPIVGKVINSKKTLEEFPYLVHGTHVEPSRFTYYNNIYTLNGVGGRGFVLAPYLANILVDNILNNTPIDTKLTTTRLFLKYAKRESKKEIT